MKLRAPTYRRKARIEIIPLIDIMFFLLACFMLVSLQMIQMRGVKINLPTSTSGSSESKSDFVTITVDPQGGYFLEKEKVDANQLFEGIQKLFHSNPELRVYVRGDKDALHGEVITALDRVRAAGVQKVAFEIKSPQSGGGAAKTP
jgi:biopolymer transport protein ExbD